MKKLLMALITLLAIPVMVNAEEIDFIEPVKGSKYYDHIWTANYAERTTSLNGINDVHEYNGGVAAIGGVSGHYYNFDTTGKLLKDTSYNDNNDEDWTDGLFKKIFQVDGKTYAITKSVYITTNSYETYLYEIKDNGELGEKITLKSEEELIYQMDDLIVKVGKNNIYFFFAEYEGMAKLSKDFTKFEYVSYDEATNEDINEVGELLKLSEVEFVIGEFDGGYVTSEDINDENDEYLYTEFSYYKGGVEKWSFKYEYYNMFPNNVLSIEYNHHIIIALFDKNYDAVLLTVDKNGKVVESNLIDSYFEGVEDYYYFKPQHLMYGDNGFYLSGYYFIEPDETSNTPLPVNELLSGNPDYNEYGAEKQEVLMYFEKKFTITSKTDGNGTVEHNDDSYYQEDQSFKITPKEGYVIDEIKVTNPETGETVVYTDEHEFVMPLHDVHIEVTFVKQVVENPKTGINDYLIFIIPVVGLGLYLYNKFNKKNAFRNI